MSETVCIVSACLLFLTGIVVSLAIRKHAEAVRYQGDVALYRDAPPKLLRAVRAYSAWAEKPGESTTVRENDARNRMLYSEMTEAFADIDIRFLSTPRREGEAG